MSSTEPWPGDLTDNGILGEWSWEIWSMWWLSDLDWLNILDSWEVMKSRTWDLKRGAGRGRWVVRGCIFSSVLPAFLFSCFQGPMRSAHTPTTTMSWPCTQSQAPWTGSCETRSWSKPFLPWVAHAIYLPQRNKKTYEFSLISQEDISEHIVNRSL